MTGGEAVPRLSDLRQQFQAFYPPTDADRKLVMTTGIVVVDTNVLLDLYRYTKAARDELLNVLRLLESRLFVPHRVALEYHSGRIGAVVDHLREQAETESRLLAAQTDAVSALNFLRNRRSLSSEILLDIVDGLNNSFAAAVARVRNLAEDYDLDPASLTHVDPLRDALEDVLHGSVGHPLAPDVERKLLAEFSRAGRQEQLPGDADKSKKPMTLAIGDYILWTQIKLEAKARALPVLVVSSDDKKDWVRKERGQTERPRRELVEEMLAEANVPLQMLQTSRFLALAREYLHAPVSAATLDQASRIREVDEHWPPIRVLEDVPYRLIVLAKCCTPIPGDELVAGFRRGLQLAVHRSECGNAGLVDGSEHRPEVAVAWALDELSDYDFNVGVEIEALADSAVVGELPSTVRSYGARVAVINLVANRRDGSVSGTALLTVPSARVGAVDAILRDIEALHRVAVVKRALPSD